MLQHEADGLFYLNYTILNRNFACIAHTEVWLEAYGPHQVAVTQQILADHIRRATENAVCSSASFWLIHKLWQHKKLTRQEFVRLLGSGTRYITYKKPSLQAKRVMDALAIIARRRGRLQ